MAAIWPAALVHGFTALGAVCGLLAVRAISTGAWEEVFAWLGLALIIDGIDGTFARLANVTRRLPRFSGERIDLVVDYVTYVFVPVLALLAAGYLPGAWGLGLSALILLSSLYHFADMRSKGGDNCFVGFPAIWNIVAFYIFALRPPAVFSGLIVLVCVGLTFVPLHYVHPLRTRRLLPLTRSVMALWSISAALILLRGFPAGPAELFILCLAAAYGSGLGFLLNRTQKAGDPAP